MLGHHVSDEIFKLLEEHNKIHLAQREGKLVIREAEESVVAIVLKKTDDSVSKLELEERTELNDSKIIVSGEIEIELNSIIDKQGSQEKISKKFTEKFLIDTVSKTLGNDFKFLENVDGYYLWVN